VWFQGRRWSLGYHATIREAEMVVRQVHREIAEWAEMRLPPPTLQPLVRALQEQQAKRPARRRRQQPESV
jgi:hypothetical protein